MSLKKKYKKNQISTDLPNNDILFKSLKKVFSLSKRSASIKSDWFNSKGMIFLSIIKK